MPRDLSVNEPRRSFCPACKYQIPWHHNLPLISWFSLRGRCANCSVPISFRYFGVELLTALLFLGIWLHLWHRGQWVLALPLWIFASIMVVATFIDFEHFIIPDEITWGGTAAGIVLSFAIPTLMGSDSHLSGGAWAILGAATGYFLLWAVVELGKKAFGKKKVVLEKVEPFTWTRHGDDAQLQVGEETQRWSEVFARPSDRLIMQCPVAEVVGKEFEEVILEFHYDRLRISDQEWELIKLNTISGQVIEIIIPREAMGFGDVKFMAAIGAFLGWKAVLFTVMAASTVGAVIGLLTIALGRREWSAKIPFGPYLALGALIWVFTGPRIMTWYVSLTSSA